MPQLSRPRRKPRQHRLNIKHFVFLILTLLGFTVLTANIPAFAQGDSKAELARAMVLWRAHKFGDALPHFDKAIKLDPNNLKARSMRAGVLCYLETAELAIPDCNRLLQSDPDCKAYINTLIVRGKGYEHIGKLDQAVADCTRSIALNKLPVDCYYCRANCYKSLGKFDLAMKDYTSLINLDKKSPDRYASRAQTYVVLGHPEQAIQDFTAALALNPQADQYLLGRAEVYTKLGQHKKAIADYDQMLKLNPEDERALTLRGAIKVKTGEYAAAVADFSKSIDLEPASGASAFEARAEAYTKLGKLDLAAKDKKMAAKLRAN